MPDSLTWCAIPVYNNAPTIFDIATRARRQLDHILVIDDGSTDADLTQVLKPLDVTVLKHPQNRGKGQALLTAFKYAADRGAQYLITLDGDGQHFPEDIPSFLPHLQPGTILIGYRQHVTGLMPRSSQFGRDFSDFWITSQSGGHARDTQSGFRAYPLQSMLKLPVKSHHYNLEMELITRAQWAGLKTASIPIHVYYPSKDQSQSSFHPLRDNARISLLHTKLLLRQLLPWPHKKQRKAAFSLREFFTANTSPLGLAFCAWISIVMSIVLYPWGFVPIIYLSIRLHLNKFVAVICATLCTNALLTNASIAAGKSLLPHLPPTLQWIAGSHLLAIPVATGISWVLYKSAYFVQRRVTQISTASSNTNSDEQIDP